MNTATYSRLVAVVAKDAFSAFKESLGLLRSKTKWSYATIGKKVGKTRQWLNNIMVGTQGGTNLRALDKICNAFAQADPPIVISPSDLLNPDIIRAKLSMTRSDTGSSITHATEQLRELPDVTTRVATAPDRLESERARMQSIWFDVYMALHRHFTGDADDVSHVSPTADQPTGPGRASSETPKRSRERRGKLTHRRDAS